MEVAEAREVEQRFSENKAFPFVYTLMHNPVVGSL
jgi:hypothetical protein